jgi:hypothetical protein
MQTCDGPFVIEKCFKVYQSCAPVRTRRSSRQIWLCCTVLHDTTILQSQLFVIRSTSERFRRYYGRFSKSVEARQFGTIPNDDADEGIFGAEVEQHRRDELGGSPTDWNDSSQLWQVRSHSQQGEIRSSAAVNPSHPTATHLYFGDICVARPIPRDLSLVLTFY